MEKQYKLKSKNISIHATVIDSKEAKELNCKAGDLLIQPRDAYSHQMELPEFILDRYVADELFELGDVGKNDN